MTDAKLAALGWGQFFAEQTAEGETCGRVIEEQKRYYFVEGAAGVRMARTSGRFRHAALEPSHMPTVGDWVVARGWEAHGDLTIDRVLTRRTMLSRKAAGADEEQILCANVDVGFVMQGLDQPPNLRRLERFVTLVNRGGARAVVALSKADLCADVAQAVRDVEAVVAGAEVLAFSNVTDVGLDSLVQYLQAGRTAVVLGPSGVGKSTFINRFAGAGVRRTRDVRGADAKGRHTTTARTLLALPGGALVIDTPGIRELELWGDADDVKATFDDIEQIAQNCRFRDCGHLSEPGCAVRQAIARGEIDQARVTALQKLRREAAARAKPWSNS